MESWSKEVNKSRRTPRDNGSSTTIDNISWIATVSLFG
jgi:hypothetical protein